MSKSKMRVDIPENPKLLLDLATTINAKHILAGATSPLKVIESHNWETEGPNIALCLAKHKEAEALREQMEEAYKDRDLLLPGILTAVKASREVLSGANNDNMKRLGDWGFDVTEAPKPRPKKK